MRSVSKRRGDSSESRGEGAILIKDCSWAIGISGIPRIRWLVLRNSNKSKHIYHMVISRRTEWPRENITFWLRPWMEVSRCGIIQSCTEYPINSRAVCSILREWRHHFVALSTNLNADQWRIQDFPEEGAPTLRGGRQHTILPNFPKNCMKLKEFGPPGGARVQNFTM